MTTDIKSIERRTAQSWFEDGIWELGFGGFCAWLALYFLGQALAPAKSTLKFIVDIGLLPWFLLGVWILSKIVRALKQSMTYRRTGFVSYKRPDKKTRTWKPFVFGALIGGSTPWLISYVRQQHVNLEPIPILLGLAVSIILVGLSFRTGAWRLVLVAAVVAAGGTVLSLWGWGEKIDLVAFYALTSVALFISGGVTLTLYLRRNPVRSEDQA